MALAAPSSVLLRASRLEWRPRCSLEA